MDQRTESSTMYNKKLFTMSGQFIISFTGDFDVLATDPEDAQLKFENEVINSLKDLYPMCEVDTSTVAIEDVRDDDYDEL